MRKHFFVYLFMAIAIGVLIPSCSDDDEAPAYPIVGKTFDLQEVMTEESDDPFEGNIIVQRPDIIEWESTNKIFTSPDQPSEVLDVVNLLLGFMPIEGAENYMDALLNSVRHISFLPDGNIQAQYVEDLATGKGNWQTSPLGVATYKIESNSKLRLFLHLDVIDQASKSRTGGVEDALLQLMPMVQDLLENGIQLSYNLTADKLVVYLDKDTLLPILTQLKSFFQDPEFCSIIKEAANQAMPGMGMFINPLLDAILRDLPSVIDGTTKIRLGINLQEVPVK